MLKKKLLKYLTKPAPAKDIAEIRAYIDAKDVGIMFTENTEAMTNFESIENGLLNDGKNIFPLMRVEKPDKEKAYKYPFYLSQDISLFGKLKSETLINYTNRSLDMLLILDEKPDITMHYVISKCQVPLRIGLATGEINSDMLNFIVKPKKEEKKHEALMEYLRMIS